MTGKCKKRFLPIALLVFVAAPAWSQVPPAPPADLEQPNARRTQWDVNVLLNRYPPSLRSVLSLDPSLLTNQSYLAPYPDLAAFLTAHPEIAHNPSFFLGEAFDRNRSREEYVLGTWRDSIQGLEVLMGFALAIALITWLLRGVMDYRRWNRLNKVQTEIHSRLLERLTGNEELMAYIQSPAGSKFLESSPITLDSGQRSSGAPLGRILWTVQAGVIIGAAGVGLLVIAAKGLGDATKPVQAFGTLGIALGVGFVFSAIISFVISRRLGLVETAPRTRE